ncbi:hypothetical protein Gotur_023744 [Gossypium turneri]
MLFEVQKLSRSGDCSVRDSRCLNLNLNYLV